MRKMKRNSILIFFASLFFIGNINGQYDADAVPFDSIGAKGRKEMTYYALNDIKEGVLIVRLSSESRKLEEIDKLLAQENLGPEKKMRLNRMRENTIDKRDEVNPMLYEAFTEGFDFSDVLFIYDTSMHQLIDGVQKGYFLGADLEMDTSISLHNMPYRIGRYGRPFQSNRTTEGFYVLDDNFNDLKYFPKFYRPFQFFIFLTDPIRSKGKFIYAVKNYSKRLEKLYYKYDMKRKYSD